MERGKICARGICFKVNNDCDKAVLESSLDGIDMERFGSLIFEKDGGNMLFYNKLKRIQFNNGMRTLQKQLGLSEPPIRMLVKDIPDAFIKQFCHDEDNMIIRGQINLEYIKQVLKMRTKKDVAPQLKTKKRHSHRWVESEEYKQMKDKALAEHLSYLRFEAKLETKRKKCGKCGEWYVGNYYKHHLCPNDSVLWQTKQFTRRRIYNLR